MGFDGDQLGNAKSLDSPLKTFVAHAVLKQQREIALNRLEARQTLVSWFSQRNIEKEIKVQLCNPYLLLQLALGRNLRMQLTEFSHQIAIQHDFRGAAWVVVAGGRRIEPQRFRVKQIQYRFSSAF